MVNGQSIIYFAEEVIKKLPARLDYKLVLLENHEDNIILRDGKVEKMLHATSLSLAVNLYLDGRDGFFYTNDLRPDSVSTFIKTAFETTRLLEPDESRTLADPARYYKGGGPDLRNFDATLSEIAPEEKIKLLQETAAEVDGSDKRIISMQTRYTDRQHQAHYLISNGFDQSEQSSYCTLTSIITVEGEGGQHPMDGWGESRIFFQQMPRTGIAPVALSRTLRKIGQRPAPSGRYRMILESPCAGNFLQPILSAMNGQALQQRTSFLWGKLGEQVVSPLVNILDDPLQPGTRGASLFDYDGVATKRRELFTEGRLMTYFIDTPMSKKLGMAPTTQGIHRLIMASKAPSPLPQTPSNSPVRGKTVCGKHSARMSPPPKGGVRGGLGGLTILVTDFNGGNCDPVTGNFSYGIEGFLIEDGIIVQPVSGMNITGNILDVWKRLSHVDNDADPWEAELIPTLTFEDVAFSGC
ncbi:MAG: TldD/PmbA family protein [Bacteroidaceae bacterium]|nr:TldD/PmbA family protein [Bacteroidaceae bacterium]